MRRSIVEAAMSTPHQVATVPPLLGLRQVGGDGKLCVFDVAPSSVGNDVVTFFAPPKDPAFHLEVKQ
jgi:hypothetical protein